MKKKFVFLPAILLALLSSVWTISILRGIFSTPIQIPLVPFREVIPRPTYANLEPDKQFILEPEITPIELVWDMLDQVNRDRALDDLRQLTGEEPICLSYGCYTISNRLTGSQGLDWAQDYLYENLTDMGYSVQFHDWSTADYADQNIIARKEGLSMGFEEVYFVAHVDGAKQSEGTYPAADDNASSVVNGLELARVLSDQEFERTLVLFFSSGEEQGRQGVKSYLDGLSTEDLSAIEYVVNRDMTGYDGNNDQVMELFHGGHPPSIALTEMMSEIIGVYQLDLDPRVVVGCP